MPVLRGQHAAIKAIRQRCISPIDTNMTRTAVPARLRRRAGRASPKPLHVLRAPQNDLTLGQDPPFVIKCRLLPG